MKFSTDNFIAIRPGAFLCVMVAFVFFLLPLSSFEQQTGYNKVITEFIDLVRQANIEKLSEKTTYPLHRKYPVPDITSASDFITRYHRLFDDSLTTLIIHSNIQTDWSQMGWRGIMFLNGTLWIDDNGILTSINNQSSLEKKEWDSLVEADKSKLYPGLRVFKEPVLYWETKKFKIRIDELNNNDYRYASWPITKNVSEKPDLVLVDGKIEFDGSGGNHSYEFKNNNYTYICSITVIGEDDTKPAVFSIVKDGKEILTEEAVKIMGD